MAEQGISDQSLKEHPSETARRLKELGEWEGAQRLLRRVKAVATRKLKKKGKALGLQSRIEICWQGWSAVHETFPPPAEAEPLASVAAYVESTPRLDGRSVDTPPPLSHAAEQRFLEIGETDDLVGDVLWAYHNIDNSAVDPLNCPSRGAWSMLSHARENRERFFRVHVKPAMVESSKRKAKAQEQSPQISRQEQLAIDEIEAMIREAVADSQAIQCPQCGHKISAAEQSKAPQLVYT